MSVKWVVHLDGKVPKKVFYLIGPDRIAYGIFGRQQKQFFNLFCYDEKTDGIVVRCELTLIRLQCSDCSIRWDTSHFSGTP